MTTAALPGHFALLSETPAVKQAQLSKLAAALTTQGSEHVPLDWRQAGTVTAFHDASAVPAAAWPLKIVDKLDEPGAAGYHTDAHGQPYALIQYVPDPDELSLTCSHEFLEMLLDPWGFRLVRMPSPDGSGHLVRVLVEVCDPCEDRQFAYRIGDVLVSDFALHPFYRTQANGRPCSYNDALIRPGQVLENGYISWEDPHDHHWKQLTNFGGQEISDLGQYDKASGKSLREWIDQHPDGAANHSARLGAFKA